ncbi:hypothetical protein H8D29_01940 [PVC group bacterium]|nr:hypothetical protein [PVC group bacterium]
MNYLSHYLDDQLSRGRTYFSREEALNALGLTDGAFISSAARLAKKHRLASPHRGFYLILRPEDRVVGAPDPIRWIDPLMAHLGLDYRISLLRAAAFHGSSHQAAMVCQVIIPKQLRAFDIGQHQIQFIYQNPATFAKINIPSWLSQIKSETGFAKVASVELTLLDCTRYFHKAAGINGVVQITHDLAKNADPGKLVKAAMTYENATVRRLGYLLDYTGHTRQAKVLEPFAKKAKSIKLLNPSVKPLIKSLSMLHKKNVKWMLLVNESVEIDF